MRVGATQCIPTTCLTIACVYSLSHLWERAGVRVILSLPRWGRVRVGANLALLLHLLIFRAVPGPHPCLPPAGEGEKTRGDGTKVGWWKEHPHPNPLP